MIGSLSERGVGEIEVDHHLPRCGQGVSGVGLDAGREILDSDEFLETVVDVQYGLLRDRPPRYRRASIRPLQGPTLSANR